MQVARSMEFYAGLFQETAKMSWPKVQDLAMTFEPVMRRKWPAYLEEINGEIRLYVLIALCSLRQRHCRRRGRRACRYHRTQRAYRDYVRPLQ